MSAQLNSEQMASIRQAFPILAQRMHGEPLVYLDNAATTQTPTVVVEALVRYYQQLNANIHRGVYQLAEQATTQYEQARQTVAKFIGANVEEVIFTSGTTMGLNLLAEHWIAPQLQPGDQILLTKLEHHANLVPWQIVAERTGAELVYLPLNAKGQVDIAALGELDLSHAKVLAIHHVSNVLGVAQPIAALVNWAKAHRLWTIVDGAQAVAHQGVNVHQLGVDAYCFSGHKLYGPTGIGVCYLAAKHHQTAAPFFYGGEMIHRVGDYHSDFAAAPYKFEGGTPPIAQAFGLKSAIEWIEQIGFDAIQAHEQTLIEQLVGGLQALSYVTIYGADNGIVSYNIEGVHPHDAATAYDLEGIAIRAGHHCAQPLMRQLKVGATLRASIAVYNTEDDIERLIDVTQQIKEFFIDGISEFK